MPITETCPQCNRLAYMRSGVCEFCGYSHGGSNPRPERRSNLPTDYSTSIYEEDFPPGVGLTESESKLREQALKGYTQESPADKLELLVMVYRRVYGLDQNSALASIRADLREIQRRTV